MYSMKDKKNEKLIARLKNRFCAPVETTYIFSSTFETVGNIYEIDREKVVDVILHNGKIVTVNFNDNKYFIFETVDETKQKNYKADAGCIRGRRSQNIVYDDCNGFNLGNTEPLSSPYEAFEDLVIDVGTLRAQFTSVNERSS